MKIVRLIFYWFAIFAWFSSLTGCLQAPLPVSTLPPTSTLASQDTNTPFATSAAIKSAEPTFTPVPNSVRQSDGMEMVYIPAGIFTMGSDIGEPEEGPVHQVYLDGFWMDLTEVTNAMYALCVEVGSCIPPVDTSSHTRDHYYDNPLYEDYPVIYVDWGMVNIYCHWAGARLPTEAEWEKAARGENARLYPWGNEWDVSKYKRVNFADRKNSEMAFDVNVDDGYRETAPVRSFPTGRSPYGIYNLAGNVWEWVADWYDPLYYNYSPQNNPQGPGGPTQEINLRSTRGGGWVAANEKVLYTFNRHGLIPDSVSSSIGFRCARSTGR